MTHPPPFSILARSFAGGPRPRNAALILGALWLAIFVTSLFAPPLLDDADATHAQAARAMLANGDLVTFHVDGIRYLEKAPLPYWLVALSYKLFGLNTFATHLPQAIAVALLALLGHRWANQAFGARTAFYTALATLTSAGVFLFTRIFIPEALLSLFLAAALFAFLKSLHPINDSTPPPQKSVILSEDAHSPTVSTAVKGRADKALPPTSTSPLERNVILSEGGHSPIMSTAVESRADKAPRPTSTSPLEKNVILSEGAHGSMVSTEVEGPAVALTAAPGDSLTIASLKGTALAVPFAAPKEAASAAEVLSPPSTTNIPERPAQAWYAGPHFYPYVFWTSLACAILTKGLIALVFILGTAALYLALTADYRQIRLLKPLSGILLFLAIAAPWHILAGLRNTGGQDGHGFFWFYFINEHVLRFLGRRTPRDYNKLPGYLFWLQHLVWLFPWSLFLPLASVAAWKLRRWETTIPKLTMETFAHRTTLLLTLFTALILLFFSLSTNQEYYTFPAYLPILLLTCAAITRAEQTYSVDATARRGIRFAHAAFTVLGATAAAALAYGLSVSRHLPFVPDIGDLLAHRGVGDYTLATSHLFDLTGPSFAALRLPAALALIAFSLGPAIAWTLRMQRRHIAATTAIAFTSGLFLVAAHVALARFAPMLSSEDLAAKIQELEDDHRIARSNQVLLFGDQAFGASIPFYLDRQVLLVDGRSTSLLFGATFPDAPNIFLTPADLLATWGKGPRKLLFVPAERRDEADRLLGPNQLILEETSGKALLTDRPLDPVP